MAEISITLLSEDEREKLFLVTVNEGGTRTEHKVSVRAADHEQLTGGKMSAEALVKASFAFLLEREPKESILRSFDLMLIGKYFPEYESSMKAL